MKPTRAKRPEATLPQTRRLGVIDYEKPTRLGKPVEPTYVKLQGLSDGFPTSTSTWSSEGITRLYQRSNSIPPSHPVSAAFGELRASIKADMLQLPDPAKPDTESCEDNQTAESSADKHNISASIGLDIQRSWSAPPTNGQVSAGFFCQLNGGVMFRSLTTLCLRADSFRGRQPGSRADCDSIDYGTWIGATSIRCTDASLH